MEERGGGEMERRIFFSIFHFFSIKKLSCNHSIVNWGGMEGGAIFSDTLASLALMTDRPTEVQNYAMCNMQYAELCKRKIMWKVLHFGHFCTMHNFQIDQAHFGRIFSLVSKSSSSVVFCDFSLPIFLSVITLMWAEKEGRGSKKKEVLPRMKSNSPQASFSPQLRETKRFC